MVVIGEARRFCPLFYPKKMSLETLREGWKKAWKEFYSFSSIGRRFQWNYPSTLAMFDLLSFSMDAAPVHAEEDH